METLTKYRRKGNGDSGNSFAIKGGQINQPETKRVKRSHDAINNSNVCKLLGMTQEGEREID